jgi:hypothetical protein
LGQARIDHNRLLFLGISLVEHAVFRFITHYEMGNRALPNEWLEQLSNAQVFRNEARSLFIRREVRD